MHSMITTSALFLLFATIFKLNHCHPSGAPKAVCDDLVPRHPAQPQTSKSPFVLIGRPKNNSIELCIESPEHIPFRGLAIQARPANASSGVAIGRFVTKEQNLHTIECFGNSDNTITHSNREDKHKVIADWFPPEDHNKDLEIIFVGTVVKTGKEFWVNLSSNKVTLNSNDVIGHSDDHHSHHKKEIKTDQTYSKVKSSSSNKNLNYMTLSLIVLIIYFKL